MKTSRLAMVAFGALLFATSIPSALAQNLPAGANTTDPSAPFYIDLTGLDFRTNPPTHNPLNPGYPPATMLPDGRVPPINANGNFIIGPTHKAAPETVAQKGVPTGKLYKFTIRSSESKIYPTALVRQEPYIDYAVTSGKTAPGDFSNILIPGCMTPGVTYCVEQGTWARVVQVYVPQQVRGREPVPFIVAGDGLPTPNPFQASGFESWLFPSLDNLIWQRKIPPMVAITVESGGQDAQGSERGFEYNSVNGQYAEFIQNEVLPRVEQVAGIRLTSDPAGRITMGASSGGEAAFAMAWFHPEWFGKVIAYSPTLINQQWPHNPNLPGGGWQYHSPYAGQNPNPVLQAEGVWPPPQPATQPTGTPLVLASPRKPIQMWFEVADQDAWYPNVMADGMHDHVLAGENMAKVLAAKGYRYQFIFSRNAGHADPATISQTLPAAIQYLMQGDERMTADNQ